ncbi:MAG: acyl-CoA thioesterase [Oscillospiraceae bacterium]|nr:acyl-CoA thioesterase [Oscillospiraceae bacterium]
MDKINLYEHRVSYYETDQMGIVHHSNYIRWFEDARIDFLEQAGFSYKKMEDTGVMIVVLGASCEYKISARFGDRVIVIPKISEFNGFKMKITYRVINKENGSLLATGETLHCFTDLNLKPVRTKKDHPEIYKLFYDYIDVDLDKI